MMSLFMILASVASMCASSVLKANDASSAVKDNDNKYIRGLEYAFCVWFTLEFGARLIFCPDKIAFFKEIMTWVDLISLLPFYENIILKSGRLNFLRAVRLIRTFRALKVFAFTSGLQIIVQSLKASFRELILLLIILLIPVVVFSSVLFEIETNEETQPDFQNIPEAFWWAIITMTTVGYGDMVPKTIPGRIIGGVCAIFGVLIVALPVSVIGNNFSTYYSHAQARLSLPKKKRRLICEAKLRMNPRHGQSPTSTTSLQQNGQLPEALTQDSREGSGTKFRRYHRRSRNTLFAHGDVYIGPSKYERNKVRREDTCNEEENENESESETKIESPTTKETVSSADLDNRSEKNAPHLPPTHEMEELPNISTLPRNFTLINSMHESEEIIEEDTRPPSVLSERRGTKKRKKMSTATIASSRRKKSNSSLSRSWVELKTEKSPQRNGRPQSSRGNKTRVSPAEARGSYKNPALELESPQNLSPQIYSVPSFKVGGEMTRLNKASVGNLPSENSIEKNTISSSMVRDSNHRTEKTNEHDLTNGFKA